MFENYYEQWENDSTRNKSGYDYESTFATMMQRVEKDDLRKRLKLTGQRWTKEGVQQMAQLRVTYKSGKWNQVKLLSKKVA